MLKPAPSAANGEDSASKLFGKPFSKVGLFIFEMILEFSNNVSAEVLTNGEIAKNKTNTSNYDMPTQVPTDAILTVRWNVGSTMININVIFL